MGMNLFDLVDGILICTVDESNNRTEVKNMKKEKINVDIYSLKCPNCETEFLLDEQENIKIIEEATEYFIFVCPRCGKKFKIFKKNKSDILKKISIEEKQVKLISEQEAIYRNIVNPGTVLCSYDKRNWTFCDSNTILWSESSPNHPLYFTTLAFE